MPVRIRGSPIYSHFGPPMLFSTHPEIWSIRQRTWDFTRLSSWSAYSADGCAHLFVNVVMRPKPRELRAGLGALLGAVREQILVFVLPGQFALPAPASRARPHP